MEAAFMGCLSRGNGSRRSRSAAIVRTEALAFQRQASNRGISHVDPWPRNIVPATAAPDKIGRLSSPRCA